MEISLRLLQSFPYFSFTVPQGSSANSSRCSAKFWRSWNCNISLCLLYSARNRISLNSPISCWAEFFEEHKVQRWLHRRWFFYHSCWILCINLETQAMSTISLGLEITDVKIFSKCDAHITCTNFCVCIWQMKTTAWRLVMATCSARFTIGFSVSEGSPGNLPSRQTVNAAVSQGIWQGRSPSDPFITFNHQWTMMTDWSAISYTKLSCGSFDFL